MTSFVEDVLLLSIYPNGEWVNGGLGPDEALGAAALADLVVNGAVTITSNRISSVNAELLSSQYKNYIYEGVKLSSAVAAIGPAAKKKGLDKLEQKGVISVLRKRFFGIIPTSRIVINDQTSREIALARLRTIEDNPMQISDDVVLLANILQAAGILPLVLNCSATACRELLSRLGEFAPVDDAVSELSEQMRVALYVTVLTSSLFRVT